MENKLDKAITIKQENMQENVHYGKIQGATSDFLWLSGASLLADKFEIDAILSDLREETIEGECRITVILDMVKSDSGDRICAGLGTWDSGEMLGNRQGARQRGIAMAYKRAYVLGVRYATATHGLFSQDDDLVKSSSQSQPAGEGTAENTINSTSSVNTQATTVIGSNGTSQGIPPEMKMGENGELVFIRFGAFVKGRTVAEVLADPTIDEKSGGLKGLGWLNWILSLDDASQSVKDEITQGIKDENY